MSITVRIPTAQYAYVEVTEETGNVQALQQQLDHVTGVVQLLGGTVYPEATNTAIQNLQEGGLVPAAAPGLSNQPPAQQYQYQQPAQQQPQTNQYGDIVLGVDPVSQKQVTHQPVGKFGKPTVKADIFANVAPWHTGPVTLDDAVKFLADKRAWNAQNGK